ncbi:uncharacterized protein N7506_006432 [Penicillium brevicompactum]|uniref:uncharacterized protein n=1 Tax=Penicillium brevicompactum TaxID=5074 RepID=UPI00254107AA|nr:uncharacterized protein N7506_006432 [Penicillium brevicompactum]KAJ5332649.1 hypothetical protein N7506_006432 [Penicillium brevicompactum]
MATRHPFAGEHDQVSDYEPLARSSIEGAHSNPWPETPLSQRSRDDPENLEDRASPSQGTSYSPPTNIQQGNLSARRNIIPDTWTSEGIAIIFSVLCFIAIVVVLQVYDQKTRPALHYGITLNAIVSILTTASKSALLFVVGECIGQLKWVWFYKGDERRKLGDMQLFDSASRAPRSIVGVFGGIVLVCALAIDPFMQQILVYPLRPTVIATGTQRAAAKQAFNLIPDALGMNMQDVAFTGAWSHDFEVAPSCPSGNCTWPEFKSIGMCSQCEDVTSNATLICDSLQLNASTTGDYNASCNIYNGNGQRGFFSVSVEQYGNISDSIYVSFPQDIYVVSHAHILLAQNDTAGLAPLRNMSNALKTTVKQCALALCSRTYQITVTNGTASTNISAPDYGHVWRGPGISPQYAMCWKPGKDEPVPVPNITATTWANQSEFAFCQASYYSLNGYFSGQVTNSLPMDNASATWFSFQVGSSLGSGNPNVPKIVRTGLDVVMRNVAASFTKAGLAGSNDTVAGTMMGTEVYVSANWLWIILPAVLTVMGVVFFILTMMINRAQRLDLWKSSILAVLFHGLDDMEKREAEIPCARVGQMEEVAEQMMVKLMPLGDEPRLALKSQAELGD